MEKIRFEQVRKTYNGRPGCACGCLGRYTLPRHVSIESANAATGYDFYDENDVSDRRCKIALTKVNKAIAEFGDRATRGPEGMVFVGSAGALYRSPCVYFCYTDKFVTIKDSNRVTTVYFQ